LSDVGGGRLGCFPPDEHSMAGLMDQVYRSCATLQTVPSDRLRGLGGLRLWKQSEEGRGMPYD